MRKGGESAGAGRLGGGVHMACSVGGKTAWGGSCSALYAREAAAIPCFRTALGSATVYWRVLDEKVSLTSEK